MGDKQGLAPQEKEVALITTRANAAKEYALKIKVETEADEQNAIKAITSFSAEWKRGEDVRKFFVDPLNAQVKAINAKFKPMLDVLKDAENMLRRKLVDRQARLQAEADAAKAKVMKQVEKGKISVEKAVEKIEDVPEVQRTVRTDEATVTYAEKPKAVMEDGAELREDDPIWIGKLVAAEQIEFLIVDTVKVRKVVLAGGKVAGTKKIVEKIPTVKSNL